MINVPDPDARRSKRYQLDLAFRAAADEAHARAMQHSRTLQLLMLPCEFVPEDIDVNAIHLADAICSNTDDY